MIEILTTLINGDKSGVLKVTNNIRLFVRGCLYKSYSQQTQVKFYKYQTLYISNKNYYEEKKEGHIQCSKSLQKISVYGGFVEMYFYSQLYPVIYFP